MKLLMPLFFAILFSGSALADEDLTPDVTGKDAQYLFNLAIRHAAFKTNPKTASRMNLESACLYNNNSSARVQICAVPDGYMNHQDSLKVNKIVMPFLTLRSDMVVNQNNFKSAVVNYACTKESATDFSCWIERH